MSISIKSVFIESVINEIEQLSLIEKMQILEYLIKEIKQSVEAIAVIPKPKYKVTDFYGIAPNLLSGKDAQEWVNQMRDEWEEREAWR
ncbi:MAG: hypothetical protein EAZ76_12630 [Nostocales cyanobacterium]|nr:MAG: hypothetical protein EAZ87_20550 [Nostocales cyanobacterium]TAF13003.1 MAG: hypothetical protein EAZ76_12630 [Nostocales cyanobacterium]